MKCNVIKFEQLINTLIGLHYNINPNFKIPDNMSFEDKNNITEVPLTLDKKINIFFCKYGYRRDSIVSILGFDDYLKKYIIIEDLSSNEDITKTFKIYGINRSG